MTSKAQRTGLALLAIFLAASAPAAELKPETIKAFDRYVAVVDRDVDRIIKSGELGMDQMSRGRAHVQRGNILIERMEIDVLFLFFHAIAVHTDLADLTPLELA